VSSEIAFRDRGEIFSWLSKMRSWRNILDFDLAKQFKFSQGRWKDGSELVFWLSVVLDCCGDGACHDGRDKIYSVLGIVDQQFSIQSITDHITPNYKVGARDLYTCVTKLVLDYSASLDYIADTGRRSEKACNLTLPSWVVDYSSGVIDYGFRITSQYFDAALCAKSIYPQFLVTTTEITCYGAQFGMINDVGKYPMYQIESIDHFRHLLEFYLSLPRHINGRRRMEMFWRNLMSGSIDIHGNNPPPSFEENFAAWFKLKIVFMLRETTNRNQAAEYSHMVDQLTSSDDVTEMAVAEDVYETVRYLTVPEKFPFQVLDRVKRKYVANEHKADIYVNGVDSSRIGRRIFTTECGLLGLGRETVQKGDQVWLLCNAHTPFLLRRTADPLKFTVVGDCYMYGFMHGEMLDDRWGLKDKIGPISLV
jgi:hypothetical protein